MDQNFLIMKIRVTEEQMRRIHDYLFKKYPWLGRKNTAYEAECVSFYDLKFDKRFYQDIKEAIS